MDLAQKELGDYISNSLGDVVTDVECRLNELMITIKCEEILGVLKFLRDDANCQFKQLMDLCGVDFPEEDELFLLLFLFPLLCLLSFVRFFYKHDLLLYALRTRIPTAFALVLQAAATPPRGVCARAHTHVEWMMIDA